MTADVFRTIPRFSDHSPSIIRKTCNSPKTVKGITA